MPWISNWFFRLAVLYLIAGVALGIGMAASGEHGMAPVHAHLNLLGWVTLALFGGFYRLWPQAAQTRLARVHFWVYVPAHFVQMVALATLYRGVPAVDPLLGISSAAVGIGILCFAVVVWRATRQPAGAPVGQLRQA
jgi:predicted permease